MSIVIPSDQLLTGYHKKISWTDANETIGTSNVSVFVDLNEEGLTHGVAMLRRANDFANSYLIHFGSTASTAFSRGGRISASGSQSASFSRTLGDSDLTYATLDSGGSFIRLIDMYVDIALNQIRMIWRSSASGKTLNAQFDAWLFKGSVI